MSITKNPFSAEKLASFSTEYLISIKAKAEEKGVDDLVKMCDFEISKRPPPPPPPKQRKTKSFLVKQFQKEIVKKLEKYARNLLKQYDLRVATAKKLSEGFPYIPTDLLSDDGESAKVGEAENRRAVVAFDRYISYRLKEDVFAFLIILDHDEDPNKTRYQITGPEHLIQNYKPIWELRPYLEKGETIGRIEGGIEFSNFEEAADYYTSLIDKVAPKAL